MTVKETWFCADCGSLDIRHDAIAVFNPDTEEYEVIAVLDETWCESCMEAHSDFEAKGDPMFGIHGEEQPP